MKLLQIKYTERAYTETEAKDYIDKFRQEASSEGYIVLKAGYTYKTKKAKGEIIAEAWICECVAEYNSTWDETDNA